MKRVLFVCLGNICRSPLAEGMFRHYLRSHGIAWLECDSAGTSGWHLGEPPHEESRRAAGRFGVSLDGQSCRQIVAEDFQRFDVILGMDRSNVERLQSVRHAAGGPEGAELGLFLEYAGSGRSDIPDPWGQGPQRYDAVAQAISNAVPAIADRLLGN